MPLKGLGNYSLFTAPRGDREGRGGGGRRMDMNAYRGEEKIYFTAAEQ